MPFSFFLLKPQFLLFRSIPWSRHTLFVKPRVCVVQGKLQKHQAFEAEVQANSAAITKLDDTGNLMISESHFSSETIRVGLKTSEHLTPAHSLLHSLPLPLTFSHLLLVLFFNDLFSLSRYFTHSHSRTLARSLHSLIPPPGSHSPIRLPTLPFTHWSLIHSFRIYFTDWLSFTYWLSSPIDSNSCADSLNYSPMDSFADSPSSAHSHSLIHQFTHSPTDSDSNTRRRNLWWSVPCILMCYTFAICPVLMLMWSSAC